MSDDEAWGQIVSLTDFVSPPILLKRHRFCIGRAADCDVSMPGNNFVSAHHCHIERDGDGKVTLHDTSTNGTLFNNQYKISKGQNTELHHGDEFYVVHMKDNEELNVGYIYQDLEELQREEFGAENYSPMYLLHATIQDSECNCITTIKSPERKWKIDEKIVNNEITNDVETIKMTKYEHMNTDQPTHVYRDNEQYDLGNKTIGEPEQVEAVKEIRVMDKSNNTSSDVTNNSTNTTKVDAIDENKTATKVHSQKDDIEENLQCMICQEIMHDCISVQPCLHSFCAGCYSDWMSRSEECPSCRKKVERINKNHIVNNLIVAYLREHPEKRRPAEDIEELNKKNKITHDMLYPKNLQKRNDSSDYSDSSESNVNCDDDGDDDDVLPVPYHLPGYVPAPVLFGFGTPVFGVQRAYKVVCRQCPDYRDPVGAIGDALGDKTSGIKNYVAGDAANKNMDPAISNGGKGEPSDGKPSSSNDNNMKSFKDDVKVMPVPPCYICPVNQNHVLCQCCLQPFPDFRHLYHGGPDERRPQQCTLCYRAFCHAYWGCRKQDCLGCLNIFKEMNFGRKSLVGLILGNPYESEIFRDYIDSKGLSVKDVLQICCKQMDAGHFSVVAQGTHQFTSELPTCYGCGLNVFTQLAFQYRKTLKKEEFPEEVRNRPDCYWGHKCRTQNNKPHHSRKFNHICDQIRQF